MLSFDGAKLNLLAEQLDTACQTQNWNQLMLLDALLQKWLVQEHAVLSNEMADAWEKVKLSHANALTVCRQAKDEVAMQLKHLENAREAQHAYAWQEVLG